MARAVGIDLGTTNSCVSVLEAGDVDHVSLRARGRVGHAVMRLLVGDDEGWQESDDVAVRAARQSHHAVGVAVGDNGLGRRGVLLHDQIDHPCKDL